MVKKKKSNKFMWFSSTLLVLILVFIIFSSIGIYYLGWKEVLMESYKYAIGFSFTAIVVYVVTYATTKKKNRITP